MKRIFITFCLLMSLFKVEAQTIHWITFIDTNDSRVGSFDVLGRQVLYSHFINEVNAAMAPIGYNWDIQDFYGDRVTPENCKSTVELLRIGSPDDIIVFYYIGHGGRPATEDANYRRMHPYPQMCMQTKFPESKYIPLEWVDKELSSKGARLSVTIGMCCNSPAKISIKDGPTFTPNYNSSSYMSGNKLSKIQELFLNTKGSVIATSASPLQTSGCFKSDFGVLDAYTTVLCCIFDLLDDYTGKFTWEDLFSNISVIVDKRTNGEQTPFHDTSNLISANSPNPVTPKTPSKESVNQTQQKQTPNSTKRSGDDDEWVNSLNDKLRTLINVHINEYNRIQLEKDLNGLFADGAVVRILGQDGETIVDREEADVFLGRLATSRLLLNVVVTEGSFDSSGRIKSLKVREIYKSNK